MAQLFHTKVLFCGEKWQARFLMRELSAGSGRVCGAKESKTDNETNIFIFV